ncbi:hypothetical protein A0W34_32380 (plasmid) [Rhodococcus sp. BH4]|uniref:hypothetical protein n=1 Tax=Rhodococcus sp. BH4 TaxID=1807790 RepID=UPI0009C253F4|nr:hypothetical protein [Rhodococcus sp. BH4]ARE38164.1 hypothetical protein A0W34_32380 [Rhodococcus sp. BH4]
MQEPVPNATQAIRYAIELLTFYVSSAEDGHAEAADYISQRLTGIDAPEPIEVIRGQLFLGEILLIALTKAEGAQGDEHRQRAVEWLAALSLHLPE